MLEFQEYNQLMWVPSFARGKLALPVGNYHCLWEIAWEPWELSWELSFPVKMLIFIHNEKGQRKLSSRSRGSSDMIGHK